MSTRKTKFDKIIDKMDIKLLFFLILLLNLIDILMQKDVMNASINIFISIIALAIYLTTDHNKHKIFGITSLFYMSVVNFLFHRKVLPDIMMVLLVLPIFFSIYYALRIIYHRFFR